MLELEKVLEQARELVTALEDKKAEDIILLDIHEVALFTDYFVICSGTSERMLRSLINAANDVMQSKYHQKVVYAPLERWIAVDFTNIVLHVFSRTREITIGWKNLVAMKSAVK